jgi:hypothetical protein
MIVPATMNIYAGAEVQRQTDPKWTERQQKELEAAMPTLIHEYKLIDEIGTIEEGVAAGYALGLATARAFLMASPAIIKAGLKPEELL